MTQIKRNTSSTCHRSMLAVMFCCTYSEGCDAARCWGGCHISVEVCEVHGSVFARYMCHGDVEFNRPVPPHLLVHHHLGTGLDCHVVRELPNKEQSHHHRPQDRDNPVTNCELPVVRAANSVYPPYAVASVMSLGTRLKKCTLASVDCISVRCHTTVSQQ